MNIYRHIKQLGLLGVSKLNKRIVVFESDDWGSTRMENPYIQQYFFSKYPELQQSWMDVYDALETPQNINDLCSVADEIKDCIGKPFLITLLLNTHNAEITEITKSDYTFYYNENLLTSAQRIFGGGPSLKSAYLRALAGGSIEIQLHGQEHVQRSLLLNLLNNRNLKDFKEDFSYGFYASLFHQGKYIPTQLRATFYPFLRDDYTWQVNSLSDSIKFLKSQFNCNTDYFVPPNGPISYEVLKKLKHLGIKGLVSPLLNRTFYFKKLHVPLYAPMGYSSLSSCVYINRNVPFEPRRTFDKNVVEDALSKVKWLLENRYPVVITSHRANYTDFLSKKGYYQSFEMLKKLIININKSFPDTLFLSSSQLVKEISNQTKHL
jgi:hypothetical protein